MKQTAQQSHHSAVSWCKFMSYSCISIYITSNVTAVNKVRSASFRLVFHVQHIFANSC